MKLTPVPQWNQGVVSSRKRQQGPEYPLLGGGKDILDRE